MRAHRQDDEPAVLGMPTRATCRTAVDSVDVIDPDAESSTTTRSAARHHVVPSYDLQTLYVTNNRGLLTPIDPKTGRPGFAFL